MDFQEFPKMARLMRDMIVTEKIDGTNAQILIGEDGSIKAGSRTRWITPEEDNYGFAAWVEANREELLKLGPGRHFGEWWGAGIQRRYGLKEKRFSLFNATRWAAHDQELQVIPSLNPRDEPKMQQRPPRCCGVVPVLIQGPFRTDAIDACIQLLRERGSYAAPGFMNPEGIVVFRTAGNVGFKRTLDNDGVPKSLVAKG